MKNTVKIISIAVLAAGIIMVKPVFAQTDRVKKKEYKELKKEQKYFQKITLKETKRLEMEGWRSNNMPIAVQLQAYYNTFDLRQIDDAYVDYYARGVGNSYAQARKKALMDGRCYLYNIALIMVEEAVNKGEKRCDNLPLIINRFDPDSGSIYDFNEYDTLFVNWIDSNNYSINLYKTRKDTNEFVNINSFHGIKTVSILSYESKLDKMIDVRMAEMYRKTPEEKYEVRIIMYCLKSELVGIMCQD